MPLLPAMLLPLIVLEALPLAPRLLGVLPLLVHLGVCPVLRLLLCVLGNGRQGGSHIPHPLQERQTQIREQIENVRSKEASGAAAMRDSPERCTVATGALGTGLDHHSSAAPPPSLSPDVESPRRKGRWRTTGCHRSAHPMSSRTGVAAEPSAAAPSGDGTSPRPWLP